MAIKTKRDTKCVRRIRARRELLTVARLLAALRPPVDVERTLRVLHPRAVRELPPRELSAIVALVRAEIGRPLIG